MLDVQVRHLLTSAGENVCVFERDVDKTGPDIRWIRWAREMRNVYKNSSRNT